MNQSDAPSVAEYERVYRAALDRLRREQPEAARAAYLDEDLPAAAKRFGESEEFAATCRILRAAGLPDGGEVLDLGAGNGIASLAFAGRGYRVTAVEPCQSAEYGAEAIRTLGRRLNLPVTVVAAWGERLAVENGVFDAVYVRQCLHHAFDLDRMLSEAVRVLRPGGLLLAVREHVASTPAELEQFRRDHPMAQMGVQENAYPVERYLSAMRAAGLRPLRVLGPHFYPINLDRASIGIVFNEVRRRLEPLTGSAISRAIVYLGGWTLTLRPVGWTLNVIRRRPGRLYSFLCCKEA